MQASFLEKQESTGSSGYLVLARKYRPVSFQDMIGQDILIKTFTNAVKAKRIAHAFLLTGIRGVGKTTTARIIAKALNCVGIDGNGLETVEPCGECYSCQAISDDRHQDVLEIDAASNTGVNDIREIIESCRYKPLSGRYKVYIIDEVHMLSNSAFNALLKTLEEPPAHVKFIFATTEIRKIPLTILSRCQRFDLKRVQVEELVKHFQDVLKKEDVIASHDALKIIANAAQGSVRDGLSILEQAISHTDGHLSSDAIRDILGLTDKDLIFSIYQNLICNNLEKSLSDCAAALQKGFDPLMIMQDFMDITHNLSKALIDPAFIATLDEAEGAVITTLQGKVDTAKLARIWSLLMRGMDEVKTAFNSNQALEMLIIRIGHLSALPSPEELIRKLKDRPSQATQAPEVKSATSPIQAPVAELAKEEAPVNLSAISVNTLSELLQLLYDKDEMIMHYNMKTDVKVIKIENGKLALNILPTAPSNLTFKMKEFLETHTNQKWSIVSVETDSGQTVAQQETAAENVKKEDLKNHPDVQGILNNFTGLSIADIKLQNAS